MNQETVDRDVVSPLKSEAGSVVRSDRVVSEYSINCLKEEINKVVWMFAASTTTLKDADDLACKILTLFVENRDKHGVVGEFDG